MKRASYKDAIFWLAHNEDSQWAKYRDGTPDGYLSVSASLVADIFDVDHEKIRADVFRLLA